MIDAARRTPLISAMTLKAAGLQNAELSEIILVGGQTRMPYIRKRVAQYFGREPRHDLNPDEVVAIGAGMLAHIANSGDCEFHDVLSMSISVGFGSELRTIIPRNSPVPCAQSFRILSCCSPVILACWGREAGFGLAGGQVHVDTYC